MGSPGWENKSLDIAQLTVEVIQKKAEPGRKEGRASWRYLRSWGLLSLGLLNFAVSWTPKSPYCLSQLGCSFCICNKGFDWYCVEQASKEKKNQSMRQTAPLAGTEEYDWGVITPLVCWDCPGFSPESPTPWESLSPWPIWVVGFHQVESHPCLLWERGD